MSICFNNHNSFETFILKNGSLKTRYFLLKKSLYTWELYLLGITVEMVVHMKPVRDNLLPPIGQLTLYGKDVVRLSSLMPIPWVSYMVLLYNLSLIMGVKCGPQTASVTLILLMVLWVNVKPSILSFWKEP